MSSWIRRSLMVALAAALALLVFRPSTRADEVREVAVTGLRESVETYVSLRLAHDWSGLYELVDPVQRQSVDLRAFLNAYGHGALRTLALTPKSTRFAKNRRAALVTMQMEGELQPEKLPASFRKSLRVDGPEDLRQSSEFELTWVLRGDGWYFDLDPTLVKGRDESGRVPQTYGTNTGPMPEVKR